MGKWMVMAAGLLMHSAAMAQTGEPVAADVAPVVEAAPAAPAVAAPAPKQKLSLAERLNRFAAAASAGAAAFNQLRTSFAKPAPVAAAPEAAAPAVVQ